VSGPPAPLDDLGAGPAPVPGRPDRLGPGLVRLTAPNPGMMTGPGTNTYLVGGAELAVVDPGPDDPEHRAALLGVAAASGAAIRWVLVTHTHVDHAPGAAPLAAATGAEVLGFAERDGFVPTRRVGDGDRLGVEGASLRAVHTPGHASDHLCWLVEGAVDDGPVLLSGDHLMHGSTVVIRPPDGDMATYLASLERLLTLDPAVALVAPGHGRVLADLAAAVAGVVGHRLARERLVAAALAVPPVDAGRTLDELLAVVYADVGDDRLAVARLSLWAHLRKLVADGRVVADRPDGDDLEVATAVRWRSVTGR
jgi:glyoxylase-like metal-dependent hydrolase (beta-lactamase superfamily II)